MRKKIAFGFCIVLLWWALSSFMLHPYHLGSVEINHNAKSQSFEITGRFFTDDLENGINQRFKTSLFFHNEKSKALMNRYLEQYLLETINLKANKQNIQLKYVGFEEDREVVNVYLESVPVKRPRQVEAKVNTLYNLFDDQINILHIIVGGKRQSHKLSYPKTNFSAQF